MANINFKNAFIYKDGGFVYGNILVENGKIAAIGRTAGKRGWTEIDIRGHKLIPGFIDIHTHGATGIDVNAASAEDLHRVARFFAGQGTTGWLCSLLTDTHEQTLKCIDQIKKAMAAQTDGAEILGIHLEGPFLAPEFKGAMPEYLLQEGNPVLFREYQQAAEGAIKYMTVSPEAKNVQEMIRQIASEVVIAIGHSGADYKTSMQSIEYGASAVTHTFNAMKLFHQHEPAIMGAALETHIFCEAICDGRHLHPGAIRLLLKCKGWDRVIAVTDSIQATGLPDGNYKLGVNDISVINGDPRLAKNGVRAGSTLTTITALKNIMEFTGQPLEKVLPLLTINPARLLRIDNVKGSIAVGKDADLVVLNDELDVMETYISGSRVFAR